MIELNSARIIRETRQTKHYLPISSAELRFVAGYKGLSDGEKLIWMIIADQCALDPNYSCTLTQSQIADLVDKTTNTVGAAISKLRALGFLKTEMISFGPLSYFLTLPQEGLEALTAAPTRKMQHPPLKTMDPSPENQGSPPRKTMDLLIYNNNINNIKHNHDSHSDFSPVDNSSPKSPVLDADALLCDFKILIKEKYQHLPISKRAIAALSHFTEVQQRAINERQLELAAISEGQKIQAERTQAGRFQEKLAQAAPVPAARVNRSDIKLIEFELDGDLFLVEEQVRDKILDQIPDLYQQNKIQGAARQKPIQTLLKEIFYYVAKAGSKALDACQLKRFYTARKLCQKGAWERPNGLERQASIHREQQWQQSKIEENRAAKAFTKYLMENVA